MWRVPPGPSPPPPIPQRDGSAAAPRRRRAPYRAASGWRARRHPRRGSAGPAPHRPRGPLQLRLQRPAAYASAGRLRRQHGTASMNSRSGSGGSSRTISPRASGPWRRTGRRRPRPASARDRRRRRASRSSSIAMRCVAAASPGRGKRQRPIGRVDQVAGEQAPGAAPRRRVGMVAQSIPVPLHP